MTTLGTRILAILCGGVLLMPPGWCCLVGVGSSSSGDCDSAPVLCSCCASMPPTDSQGESPLSPGQSPTRCFCADREGAVPPEAVTFDAAHAAALCALLPAFSTLAPTTTTVYVAWASPRTASPPRHVLHCVWLC